MSTHGRSILYLILLSLGTATLADDAPSWYQRKKQVQKEKKAVEDAIQAEKPIVGKEVLEPTPPSPAVTPTTMPSAVPSGTPSPTPSGKPVPAPSSTPSPTPSKRPELTMLTPEKTQPPIPSYLFKKEGLTDTFNLKIGKLGQQEINGTLLTGQYNFGWWWRPTLVLSFFARGSVMFADTFVFMMVSLGPHLRWFATQHWMIAGSVGYQFSQGLSKVPATHIPPPPNPRLLSARHGISGEVEIGYMFWPKRTLAIGPTLSFGLGFQSERTFSLISLGITFQSGRPDFQNGDVTRTW